MYGNHQTLQNEKYLREKKKLQYKLWKTKNPQVSSKRKRDAEWVRDNTNTVNSDYPNNLFNHI